MQKLILAAAVAALCGPAVAAQYVLIVPMMSTANAVKDIKVTLSAGSLAPATVGHAYAADLKDLVTISGDPNQNLSLVNWSVIGGQLPTGLSLQDGSLTGTPTVPGNTSFTIQVTYKTKTGQQVFTVPVDLTVQVATSPLAEAVVGVPYAAVDFNTYVSTTDGDFDGTRVSWRVQDGSTLPPGLALSSAGVLSGTPISAFNGNFTVVASYKGIEGSAQYSQITRHITVALSPTLPEARLGRAYTHDLVSGLSIAGDPTYKASNVTFAVQGTLPAGLTLNSAGVLSGTPTEKAFPATPVTIQASYRGVSGSTTVAVPVKVGIVKSGEYRRWADGSMAASCNEYRNPAAGYVYEGDTGDGIYDISPPGVAAFSVKCDQTSDGGGWTVIQHRSAGTSFYNGKAAYIAGFGSIFADYWIGLDRIKALTATPRELRVDLGRYTGQRDYGRYAGFAVGAYPHYTLSLGAFVAGGIGDSLSDAIGMSFSTYDNDLDREPGSNCAVIYRGAWWYHNCHASNLNGAWLVGPHTSYADGVEWYSWTGHYESLTYSEMKVR